MKILKPIIKEVFQALLPILCVIILFNVFFIKSEFSDYIELLIGVLLTALGMFLYQLGAKFGLLPIGEYIGSGITKWGTTRLVVLVFLTIGVAITLSEPNVMVLGNLIETSSQGALSATTLSLAVAIGAGIMLTVAIICMIKQVPFKYLYLIGYGLVIVISFFVPNDFVAMAFDAGGFSSGLISNPFLLTTGIGIASIFAKRKGAVATGFGIIGFTALGPILAIMLIGVLL